MEQPCLSMVFLMSLCCSLMFLTRRVLSRRLQDNRRALLRGVSTTRNSWYHTFIDDTVNESSIVTLPTGLPVMILSSSIIEIMAFTLINNTYSCLLPRSEFTAVFNEEARFVIRVDKLLVAALVDGNEGVSHTRSS